MKSIFTRDNTVGYLVDLADTFELSAQRSARNVSMPSDRDANDDASIEEEDEPEDAHSHTVDEAANVEIVPDSEPAEDLPRTSSDVSSVNSEASGTSTRAVHNCTSADTRKTILKGPLKSHLPADIDAAKAEEKPLASEDVPGSTKESSITMPKEVSIKNIVKCVTWVLNSKREEIRDKVKEEARLIVAQATPKAPEKEAAL